MLSFRHCAAIAKIVLIILALSCFIFLNILPQAPSAASTGERNAVRTSLGNLSAKERELAEQIITLNFNLRQGQSLASRIEKDILKTKGRRDTALILLQEAEAQKKASLERLAYWLRFKYIQGNLTYLDIIFSSSSFTDFFNKASLLAFILGQEAKAYGDAFRSSQLVAGEEKKLRLTEERLLLQTQHLKVELGELQKLKNHREKLYREIRNQSSKLADKLYAMEKSWISSLDILNLLADCLISVTREYIEPDRYYPGPGGFIVEYSESNLNKAISNTKDPRLSGLTLQIDDATITIRGGSQEGRDWFRLTGRVSLSDDHMLHFTPDTLVLDGAPVSPRLAEEIAPGFAVSLKDLPGTGFFSPSKVTISEGKLKIILR